jgi:hypothetical protein
MDFKQLIRVIIQRCVHNRLFSANFDAKFKNHLLYANCKNGGGARTNVLISLLFYRFQINDCIVETLTNIAAMFQD